MPLPTYGTLCMNEMENRPSHQKEEIMKVLIIEDDSEVVEAVSLCFDLRWPDVEFVAADEGTAGINLVEKESPDIVILDIGLPDIDGFEVCRRIRLFSDVPIMILSVTGNRSAPSLLRVTRRIIKDRLEKVEGVASASISGGQEREILVEIDQGQLQARRISLLSIVESLKNSNLNYPAGTVKEDYYEYLVRTMGENTTIEEFGETVIKVGDEEEQDDIKAGISPSETSVLQQYKQSKKTGERR